MNKNQIIEDYQKHSRISSFLIRILIFVIFWVVALAAIIASLGLHIDWRHFRIQETGIVYLSSSIGELEAAVKVDGLSDDRLPASFTKMPESNYSAEVKKPGFVTWNKNFEVDSSRVSAWENIVLITNRPATVEETDQLNRQIDEPLDKTIIIKNNELWVEKVLITRFSDNITNAIWYTDGAHIVYQIKNKIKIIEEDGKNETNLVSLSSDAPVTFRLLSRGQELLYQDGDQVLVAEIY